jgi:peptidoglycan/LPS O-acetylase OafA/YrhL
MRSGFTSRAARLRASLWENLYCALLAVAISTVVFSVLDAGYLLCLAFDAVMIFALRTKRRGLLFLSGLPVVAIGVALVELSSASESFAHISYVPAETARAVLAIGASLLLPFLCSERVDKAFSRIRKPTRIIAAGSYTLCPVHFPVLIAADAVLPRFTELSGQGLACFAARNAACSVLCFERNTAAVRRWLGGRRVAHRE